MIATFIIYLRGHILLLPSVVVIVDVTFFKLVERCSCVDLKLVVLVFCVFIKVLNISFCVKLLLLCFFAIDVARSFKVVVEGTIELQATVLTIAVMFDSFILLLIFLALGPLHASFFTNISWRFVSKHDLVEVESFVVILLLEVWVVL
jgi:hypothetical protein